MRTSPSSVGYDHGSSTLTPWKEIKPMPSNSNSETPSENKYHVGDFVERDQLVTMKGQIVSMPDPRHLIHLQFRRFAGCPICNLHLRSFILRSDEIAAAGVREVVVFHSTAEELVSNQSDIPFDIIPDPEKRLCREYGVGSSWRSVLHPGALTSVPRAAWLATTRRFTVGAPLPLRPATNGRKGLPADFLVTTEGYVAGVKYGRHSGDSWSVDEVLAAAATVSRRS
jgi:peroxiredoxin